MCALSQKRGFSGITYLGDWCDLGDGCDILVSIGSLVVALPKKIPQQGDLAGGFLGRKAR